MLAESRSQSTIRVNMTKSSLSRALFIHLTENFILPAIIFDLIYDLLVGRSQFILEAFINAQYSNSLQFQHSMI